MSKVIVLCLSLLLFSACQNKTDKEQVSPEEIARQDSLALKIGLMPTTDCLPFYYAEEHGIYDSLHLDLRIKTYQSQMDCDTALAGNTVQVCYTDLIRAILLQQKRTGLHVIMSANGNYQLIGSNEKKIARLKNLKGKMVGIARHSATDFLSDYLTVKAQIDTTDIFRPQINDLNIRLQMLQNATLDAAFLPEPYATIARMEGNNCLYQTNQDSIFLNAFMIRHDALNDSNRNDQIKKLVAGYNQAVVALNKKLESNTLGSTAHLLNIPTNIADSIQLSSYKKAGLPQSKQIRTAISWLQSRNLISSDYQDTLCISTYIHNH